MKIGKILTNLCLAVALAMLCLFLLPTTANAATENGFTYTVSNGEATITDYNGSATDLTIPSTLGGYPVTTIGGSAFSGCSGLTNVVIPSGVTAIGDYAFRDCTALRNVTLGNGVTDIGDEAFANCTNLRNLTFGNNVSSISASALENCNRLVYNTYDTGNYLGNAENPYLVLIKANSATQIHSKTRVVYSRAFYGSSIKQITIPANIKGLGEYAFANCAALEDVYVRCTASDWCKINGLAMSSLQSWYGRRLHFLDTAGEELTSLALDDTVTEIPSKAFYFAVNVTQITLPDGVAYIGDDAFEGSALTYNKYDTADYLGTTTNPYAALVKGNSATQIHTDTKVICEYAFAYTELIRITIPDSVQTIGDLAFLGSENLTSVQIGSGVQTIGERAFFRCTALAEITIPDSVTDIGDYAFANCTNLVTVKIGAGVEQLNSYVFSDCTKLSSITFGRNIQSISTVAFRNCNSLTDVYIYDPSAWCNTNYGDLWDYAKNLHILGANDEILTEIVLDATVWRIPENAFTGCTSMTSIVIPDSLETIHSNAFKNCTGLSAVVVPDSVDVIYEGAFSGCNGLQAITVPFVGYTRESATPFGYIFGTTYYNYSTQTEQKYCLWGSDPVSTKTYYIPTRLEEVTVTGKGADDGEKTTIWYGAFYNCINLKKITLGEALIEVGDYAFYNCGSLSHVNIPENAWKIGISAFENCDHLTEITIGDKTTEIGERAFYDCLDLNSIVIGDGVTKIGASAFAECEYLRRVTIGEGVEKIDSNAFLNCSNCHVYIKNVANWCKIQFVNPAANPLHLSKALYVNGVSVTDLVIPGDATRVGNYAFQGCTYLKSITMEEGVTTIGENAFFNCRDVESVSIPASLWQIKNNAFWAVSAANVYIYDASAWCRVSFGEAYANPMEFNMRGHIMNADGEELTHITLTNVTKIPKCAFRNCNLLESVTLPSDLKSIGASAFYGCTALNDLSLPKGLQKIEDGSFSRCIRLESIIVPDSVTTFGIKVFENCEGLKTAVIGRGVKWLPSDTFYNCISLETVTLPEGLQSIGEYAFWNCASLQNIAIPESVTTIGEGAFFDCSSLKTINISANVTQISDSTNIYEITNPFSGCTSLTGIWADENNANYSSDSVGALLNKDKTVLYSVPGGLIGAYSVPYGVKTVKGSAFEKCIGLEYISICNGVTTIENYAFNGCSNLKAVRFPISLTTVGADVFRDCSQFKTIFYPGTEQQKNAISVHREELLPNEEYYAATWHYEVVYKIFAQQECWYCPRCDKCYFFNGDEALATVTFENWDGTKLLTQHLPYGRVPATNITPTRPHEQPHIYKYVFAGWDKPFASCTDNVTYTATYEEAFVDYKVQFANDDGSVISEMIYHYGDIIAIPEDPTKASNDTADYVFAGWDPTVSETCQGDATYTAVYTEQNREGWQLAQGKWMYYSGGVALTGWQRINNEWYYMNAEGIMQTGWLKEGNTWYYLKSSGAMVTGWLQQGTTWYYLNSGGAMATGWKSIGGTYYYFNASGAMAIGWLRSGNTWYYLKSSGAMATGWQKVGGVWYYFQSGGAMQTGWLRLGSTWYYFNSSGAMATGSLKIGAKTYKFNTSGACLNP